MVIHVRTFPSLCQSSNFSFCIGCIFVLRITDRKVSHEDKTIQVAATVGCAYVSFFLAQYVLGVSGVISCVCSGVVIAWLGPPLVLQVN